MRKIFKKFNSRFRTVPFLAITALPTFTLYEKDLDKLIINIFQWMVSIAGIVALGYLIYGGIAYITASGNAEKAQGGKNIILSAIVGIIISVIAYAIILLISSIVGGAAPGEF